MPFRIGDTFNKDPNSHRTGWTFEPSIVEKRLSEVLELKQTINLNKCSKLNPAKVDQLLETIDLLRAVVYLCYPGYNGLPEWEPCLVNLESKEDLLNKEDSIGEWLKYDNATFWVAGRQYDKAKYLSEYIGKNEKTCIVGKFSSKGSGAPVREPPIDSETQKRMMAIYHKKQEEGKKLETNTEEDYLTSQWADSKSLKTSLYTGGADLKWKMK